LYISRKSAPNVAANGRAALRAGTAAPPPLSSDTRSWRACMGFSALVFSVRLERVALADTINAERTEQTSWRVSAGAVVCRSEAPKKNAIMVAS
jgi:hypothetical protein